MGYPSLRTIPWIREQANMKKFMEAAARFSGTPRGSVRATVVDVDDPQDRGRVRVLFDAMNGKDIPSVEGAGEYSTARGDKDYSEFYSHWLDTSPPFKGKQPPGLIGKRVNVVLTSGQYQYAVLQDVVYDPELLTDTSAKELTIPNNSTMVRLPIYPANNLPLPHKENAGCMVIEEGGPMNSDWVCVCLKRDGKYIWVRHSDLAHGHAGGNDITSLPDSSGNRPGNGQVAGIWDHVYVTSHKDTEQGKRNGTVFGTAPRGNPWGPDAGWSPPPMNVDQFGEAIEKLPNIDGVLFDQVKALDFVREPGFTKNIPGSFTPTPASDIPSLVSSVPGVNFASDLLKKGQDAYKLYSKINQAISDPISYVSKVAIDATSTWLTQATSNGLKGITDIKGLIKTVYSSVKQAIGL